MLQVVIFSIIVGIALVSMAPEKSRPMLDLLDSLQQICMTVIRWAMRLAPVAVFGLMAQLTTTLGFRAMLGMASYVATVIVGLLVLLGVVQTPLHGVLRVQLQEVGAVSKRAMAS